MSRLAVLTTDGTGCFGSHIKDELLTSGLKEVYSVDNADPFDEPAIKVSNLQKPAATPAFILQNFIGLNLQALPVIQPPLFIPSNSAGDKNPACPGRKAFFIAVHQFLC